MTRYCTPSFVKFRQWEGGFIPRLPKPVRSLTRLAGWGTWRDTESAFWPEIRRFRAHLAFWGWFGNVGNMPKFPFPQLKKWPKMPKIPNIQNSRCFHAHLAYFWTPRVVQSRLPMYFKKLKIQPKILKRRSKTVPIFDFWAHFWLFSTFLGPFWLL